MRQVADPFSENSGQNPSGAAAKWKTEWHPFWASVSVGEADACWPWQGSRDRDGYGRLKIRGHVHRASRFALALATGQEPQDLHALHSCDNPPCCNPAHLRWGTPVENMEDKSRRGRWRGPKNQSGSANGAAKLTDEQLAEIVRRMRAGLNNLKCAAGMPISDSMVSKIRTGVMWREQTAALGWEPRPMFERRRAVRLNQQVAA